MQSKCRKDEDHDLWYGPGPLAEVRLSFHVPTVALEWAATAPSATAASTGCTRNAVGKALDKGPWLEMYTVPGNCTPFEWQTTEGSPSWTWQPGGGSFLLLPRRHALSSWWLWTFNHNLCENRLEEVQGAATSSFFPPPVLQGTCLHVQLLCAERNAPCQWDLASDKPKPPMSAAKWQGNDQTALQCQAARSNELLAQLGIEDLDLILKERRLCWYGHVERPNSAIKTAFDLQADGGSWQRGIAESGSSQLSTLMTDIPGDLVWDLPYVQCQLPGRGPTDVDVAPVPAC